MQFRQRIYRKYQIWIVCRFFDIVIPLNMIDDLILRFLLSFYCVLYGLKYYSIIFLIKNVPKFAINRFSSMKHVEPK